jgi:broad specificity phosphatase PhoE
VPRLVLAELNDIRFGEFEGRLLTEYRAWAHSHGPDEPAPGGGDSRAQTVARYVAAYGELLDRPEASVLVVAHGLPVRYVLDAVEGHNPAAAVARCPTPSRSGSARTSCARPSPALPRGPTTRSGSSGT